jgi:putative SOS response-associated peptidase YedK
VAAGLFSAAQALEIHAPKGGAVCGRFVVFSNLETLVAHFAVDRVEAPAAASYNVAPSQPVAAVVRQGKQNVLVHFQWGLVPFWAKDPKIASRLINARAETASTKPSFRAAFRKRRCLVAADGFYEWRGAPGQKQPVYITLPEEAPMAFAGLWEVWDDRGRAEAPLRSCTILTTAASPALREIHDRMPLVLKPAAYRAWLDPQLPEPDLPQIIAHHTHRDFRFWPVSTAVNAVRNDYPELIAALS